MHSLFPEWQHFSSSQIFHSSNPFHCRWTPMRWELGKTWVTLCWWRLRRRNTGCRTTGTASTSPWKPQLENMWNSPASAGWWMIRKWCFGMDEVVLNSSGCLSHLFFPLSVKRVQAHFVTSLLQHFCLRMIRPAWWSSTDRKNWIRGGKPTGRFNLLTQRRRSRLLVSNLLTLQVEGVAAGLSYEHRRQQTQGPAPRHPVWQWERSGFHTQLQ